MRTLENRNSWSSLLHESTKPTLHVHEITVPLKTTEIKALVKKKISSDFVKSRFIVSIHLTLSYIWLIDWLTDWLTGWLIDWLIDRIPTRKPYKCTTPGYTPYPTNHKKDNGWQLHDSHKTIDAQNGGAVHKCRISSSKEESYQTGYNCPC